MSEAEKNESEGGEETEEGVSESNIEESRSGEEGVDTEENEASEDEDYGMTMVISGTEMDVEWEDNASVEALRKLVKDGSISVQMAMYGGFEQVGSIGSSLPRNDVRTTTKPGDIVLYSGNQIVVFYGSNTWSYTKLGHISGMNETELTELLGNGDVSLKIF